jgi:hypothetical protein
MHPTHIKHSVQGIRNIHAHAPAPAQLRTGATWAERGHTFLQLDGGVPSASARRWEPPAATPSLDSMAPSVLRFN